MGPAGNDANDGLTAGTAKATFTGGTGALSVLNAQPAGSALRVLGAVTDNGVGAVTAGGVIIRSDPPGSRFILSQLVLTVNAANVTIQDLEFQVGSMHEAAIVVAANGCTIQSCSFTGVAPNGGETFVIEDEVAPIQVVGAGNLTVRNCIFTADQAWDYCVVLSDAAGAASGITFDGCTVNSNNLTGGLRAYRAYDNVQVTNSNFITMRRAAWEFSYIYPNSLIDPGTASNLLFQDLNITGHSEGASFNAAIHFRQCSAENIQVRRVNFSQISGNGQDAVRIHNATVDTIILDTVEYTYPPIGNNDYYIPLTMETNVNVVNATIVNCSFTTAIAFRCDDQVNNLSNMVIKDSVFTKTPYRAANNMIRVRSTSVRGCTMDNVTIVGDTGDDLVSFFGNPLLRDLTIRRCTIRGNAGDESIVILDGAVANVLIEDCSTNGDGHGISIKNGATTVNGITIRGCTITALSNGTTDAGAISFNEQGSGGPTLSNVTLENLWLYANFGVYVEATNLSNAVIRNTDMRGDGVVRRGLEMRGSTLTNVQLSDLVLVGRENGLNVNGCVGSGLSLTNVSALPDAASFSDSGLEIDFNGGGVSINGAIVDGGGTGAGLVLGTGATAAGGWTVQNGTLSNCVGAGLFVGSALQNSSFTNLAISNSSGAGLLVGNRVTDCTFTSVSVDGVTGGPGIIVDNSTATGAQNMAARIAFFDCAVDGADGIGINVQGVGHRVQGCTVENGGSDGIAATEPSGILAANAGIAIVSNTVRDCPQGVAVALEGKNSTVGWNTLYRNGGGIRLRSGITSARAGSSNTTNNSILRNAVYGGAGSATGIFETFNIQVPGDTGPGNNAYVNNTVTDWGGHGSEFIGAGNTIQNNIFAFNGGSGLRVLSLTGLTAGWNCAAMNGGVDFDGISVDYSKDIWYDPDFVSRTPGAAGFYRLSPTSGALDRGTPVGTGVDLGAIESGASEVPSWRVY
ncbi:right-handed parallel beta-helix repeat-containing protein [bacterium]|nr:right-handed parallel beta-helix repeat-containing protein [bacterium]